MSLQTRILTCILCPRGCDIEVQVDWPDGMPETPDARPGLPGKSGGTPAMVSLSGAGCPRGAGYVERELQDPRRIVTTSVRVTGGTGPLTSVRLTKPVPRDQMQAVVSELKKLRLTAPVWIGQVVVTNILGLGSDVIVTKAIAGNTSDNV